MPINVRLMSPRRVRLVLTASAVLIGLLCLYLTWWGQLYDGDALKQSNLHVLPPVIQGANHPYSQLWFWAWLKLAPASVRDSLDSRMAWMAGLNGLLGAGSATLMVLLLKSAGVRLSIAVGCALLAGLSHAWFYHSTQVTEPMLAQFLFLGALALAIPERQPSWLWGALSGFAWAGSVAAYQSYFLGGLGLLVLNCSDRRRAVSCVVGAGILGGSLFSLAAILQGAHSPGEIAQYLTAKSDGHWWGFWTLSALPQVPIGLAQAFALPWPARNWPGLKEGWASLSGLAKGLMIAQILATLAAVGFALFKLDWRDRRRLQIGLLLIVGLGMFAPYYLKPYYNKLWLLPLSALIVLIGLAIAKMKYAVPYLLGFLTLVLAANVPRVYQRLALPDPVARASTAALEQTLRANDLLISEGWYYSLDYARRHPELRRFEVVAETGGPESLELRCTETFARGGRVFVFGLLELTEARWNASDINKRLGRLQYHEIQALKPRSKLVWQGKTYGIPSDLYELLPPSPSETKTRPLPAGN